MRGLRLDVSLTSKPGIGGASQTVLLAVLAGQSNMEGRSAPDRVNTDLNVTNAYQFVGYSGDPNYQTIQSDITPLWHVLGYTDVAAPQDRLGPGEYICRQLLADNQGSTILLVPCARGSTALASGTPLWAPSATPGSGGSLFENMVSQSNLAYTAAQSMWPGATIVVQIYWSQGEQDAGNGCTYATYESTLEQFVANARTRITGASSAKFIIGSMIPQKWVSGDANYSQAYADINHAQVTASLNVSGVYYAMGPYPGSSTDGLHYTPASYVRTYGQDMGATLSDVTGPTVTSASTYSNTLGTALSLALTGSDVHQTFHINGGADAAQFQISDPYLTPTLEWASNGTGPATNGTYVVGVRARDGSGNFGPTKTVSVTVANEVNPASFFTNSEKGMVWDLSDLTNLSQTIDGATPVTATGQSVGYVKDLSPNANHWIAAANNTSRPTLQQDANGKYYLQFNGTSQVLIAAAPFVDGASSVANTAVLGLNAAAQSTTKVLLASNSSTTNTPFVYPFESSSTTTSLTLQGRNDASSSIGTQPTIAVLDSANHVITSKSAGFQTTSYMRDAATRNADGTGYTTVLTGSVDSPPASVTRAGLGGTAQGTPGAFFNGKVYSGFVISRILTDAETANGENWVGNRTLTTKLPGQP